MKKKINIIYLLTFGLLFSSCSKDFLNVDPQSTINPEQLGSSSAATLGILKGVYATLRTDQTTGYAGHEDYGHKGVLSVLDLMGNDEIMENLSWGGFNYNYTGRVATNSRAHFPWFTYYTQIKNVNTIINNVDENTADPSLKAIRGQAIALRGYFHFMLARIYGPTYVGHQSEASIPINAAELSSKRNTVEEVYTQIISDLQKGIEQLEGYTRPNREMIDQGVAKAFLADVFLETGNYKDAAKLAREARQGYTLLDAKGWKNGFYDINQDETMWGADINSELTSFVASFFSLFDNTNTGYAEGGNITMDRRLYDAMSDSDIRKSLNLGASEGEFEGVEYGPYMNFKFRDLTSDRVSGDYLYLRSALMYYIEAEGLARTGDEQGAKNVLLEITSKRDPKYTLSSNSGAALINEIILQKRIEMWGEGFAWFDLKRLKQGVVRNYPGSNHPDYGKFNIPAGDSKFLFMIPQAEVDANPAILPNNPQ
jgi:hypothetical protein